MDLAPVVVLVHALTGIIFVVGLVGRWIVLGMSERAADLRAMRILTNGAQPFERIVIVSSGLVLLFGVAAALMQSRNILGPFGGGTVDWMFVSLILYISNIPLIPLVFLPRGRVFAAAFERAEAEGVVTPELSAAWGDPVVRGAHVYELATTTIVLILMLTQPF